MHNLNQLPIIYLSYRSISLFTAFLKRYRYFSENDFIDLHRHEFVPTLLSSPFTFLIQEISRDCNIKDSDIEFYFKIILDTQSNALIPNECVFFDYWLTLGSPTWKFLKLGFESLSEYNPV